MWKPGDQRGDRSSGRGVAAKDGSSGRLLGRPGRGPHSGRGRGGRIGITALEGFYSPEQSGGWSFQTPTDVDFLSFCSPPENPVEHPSRAPGPQEERKSSSDGAAIKASPHDSRRSASAAPPVGPAFRVRQGTSRTPAVQTREAAGYLSAGNRPALSPIPRARRAALSRILDRKWTRPLLFKGRLPGLSPAATFLYFRSWLFQQAVGGTRRSERAATSDRPLRNHHRLPGSRPCPPRAPGRAHRPPAPRPPQSCSSAAAPNSGLLFPPQEHRPRLGL